MLKEAYGMNLKDKVAETLYLGTLPDNNKYVLSKKQLEPELSILFPGKTEVEEYFKDILKA
ncbi:hypothetical protein EDD78_11289 [Harryflintia acetispora]|uniref:Uncharacterized protein n=2 Tax=Harryflintia acetispora TaxID=1849041 RepID=A0A9X8UI60_9FIRM|nr:hypothetical protein EDD78_11289 [Harryflintia acetispora]